MTGLGTGCVLRSTRRAENEPPGGECVVNGPDQRVGVAAKWQGGSIDPAVGVPARVSPLSASENPFRAAGLVKFGWFANSEALIRFGRKTGPGSGRVNVRSSFAPCSGQHAGRRTSCHRGRPEPFFLSNTRKTDSLRRAFALVSDSLN